MVKYVNKIMIVEDDLSICNELSKLLENNNYETIVLKNFKNALNEILETSPNLILLDINMPYINGEALLQELRKKANIPVIMVTSINSETDEALSISYGADDYITKPTSICPCAACTREESMPANRAFTPKMLLTAATKTGSPINQLICFRAEEHRFL